MRTTFIAALVSLGVVLAPQVATATTQSWYPGGDFGSPVYTMPIPVIDTVASSLSPEHRSVWRQARNAALADWAKSGITFRIEVRKQGWLTYPWTTENINGGLAITDIQPGAIMLVRDLSGSGQESAGYECGTGIPGGVAAFSMWSGFWAPNPISNLIGTIGHEVGHALGFGHGGHGIMMGSNRPDAEELGAVRAYYGVS